MSEPGSVDITGRVRSPAATPGHWAGYAPPNEGRYPADPPTVEEIILVMREAAIASVLCLLGFGIGEAAASPASIISSGQPLQGARRFALRTPAAPLL